MKNALYRFTILRLETFAQQEIDNLWLVRNHRRVQDWLESLVSTRKFVQIRGVGQQRQCLQVARSARIMQW
jgi:hypothetical protein